MTTQNRLTYEIKRAALDADTFTGFAAVYGNRDRAGEIVEPGAFDKTLRHLQDTGTALPMLWNHDTSEPIGVVESLDDSSEGLRIRASLFPELRSARTAKDLIAGGAGYLSIGYQVESAAPGENGIRHLTALDLLEISMVPTPANPLATIDRKSATEWARSKGLSARKARKVGQAVVAAVSADGPEELALDDIAQAQIELRQIQTKYFNF